MNCREAQHQLFAASDGAPDPTGRATLETHVAHCAECRRIRDDLTAALTVWRADAGRTVVPDAGREWHAVRRRLRGGVEAGATRRPVTTRSIFSWLTVPLGAAATLAIALLVTRHEPAAPSPAPARTQIARADSVEVPGNNASTMVFVDDKSGWLIVWASDAPPSG